MTETGAKKKLSSDGTALNLNVEASATVVNGYQPGNLVSQKTSSNAAFYACVVVVSFSFDLGIVNIGAVVVDDFGCCCCLLLF